jgi:hypothetical protein
MPLTFGPRLRAFLDPYGNPKVDRLIVRIDAERVTGSERWQPWDVTPL